MGLTRQRLRQPVLVPDAMTQKQTDKRESNNRTRAASPKARVWSDYKRKACLRGRLFAINKDEFMEMLGRPCHYCGAAPDPVMGVDRRDNGGGYTADNTVPCCWDCNNRKRKKPYGVYVREQAEAGNPVCQARLNELLNQEATHATEGRDGS